MSDDPERERSGAPTPDPDEADQQDATGEEIFEDDPSRNPADEGLKDIKGG